MNENMNTKSITPGIVDEELLWLELKNDELRYSLRYSVTDDMNYICSLFKNTPVNPRRGGEIQFTFGMKDVSYSLNHFCSVEDVVGLKIIKAFKKDLEEALIVIKKEYPQLDDELQ